MGLRSNSIVRKHFWVPVISLILLSVVGAYSLFVPPVYEVSGTVVVHRQRVENPNASGEEEKNRWIWVRDGMGLKESLLSDKIWLSALNENALLQTRYADFVKKHSRGNVREEDLQVVFAQNLVRQVSVDFTGGDSYSYVLSVKDRDPQFAKALVTALIDRAKQKLVQDGQKAYQASLDSIQNTVDKTKNEELRWYLKHSEKQLRLSSILFDSAAGSRVEVVRTPHIPLKPIWPKPLALALVALVLGVALGLGIEVSLNFLKGRDAVA